MNKDQRVKLAEDTVKIQDQGFYKAPSGKKVEFGDEQRHSEGSSYVISPEKGKKLVAELKPLVESKNVVYKVVNESTVQTILDEACFLLPIVAALNFASAKHPGGGFLAGCMAQEEALAYSSGLYNTLKDHKAAYYDVNRADKTAMYTDTAIYSHDVVFFRDADYKLVENPVKCSVLTLPAVNMGFVAERGKDENVAKTVMKNRMRLALAILAVEGNKTIILGAYGCGVFKNNPIEVATWWKELLHDEKYGCFFEKVIFTVMDSKDGENITAFENVFGKGSR